MIYFSWISCHQLLINNYSGSNNYIWFALDKQAEAQQLIPIKYNIMYDIIEDPPNHHIIFKIVKFNKDKDKN